MNKIPQAVFFWYKKYSKSPKNGTSEWNLTRINANVSFSEILFVRNLSWIGSKIET